MSSTKGSRRERHLVNELDTAGFAVMRAPSSGSATERELPDALAGDGETFIAVEAKASGGDPIYLDAEEVDALEYFAGNFGAEALIGVRFDVDHGDPPYGVSDDSGWRFLQPSDCHVTDSGNFRAKKELAYGVGERLRDLRSDAGGDE